MDIGHVRCSLLNELQQKFKRERYKQHLQSDRINYGIIPRQALRAL